jgi:urease accessory protein
MRMIQQLIARPSAEKLRGKEVDKLVLTWEQRRWVRGRFITTAGREIALALATGTRLKPGTILLIEPQWYVEVIAADEPVLEVFVPDRASALKVAFEVGNRHFPLALSEQGLLVPDDPAMVNLMERLGVRFERRLATFEPIGAPAAHADGA